VSAGENRSSSLEKVEGGESTIGGGNNEMDLGPASQSFSISDGNREK